MTTVVTTKKTMMIAMTWDAAASLTNLFDANNVKCQVFVLVVSRRHGQEYGIGSRFVPPATNLYVPFVSLKVVFHYALHQAMVLSSPLLPLLEHFKATDNTLNTPQSELSLNAHRQI